MQRILPVHGRALLATLFLCLSFVSSAAAERATVLLKNGGQATGEIVLHLPDDRITLDLGHGERATFAAADIAEIRKEEAEPSRVAAAPAPGVASGRPALAPPQPPPADPMKRFGLSLKLGLRATVNTKSDRIHTLIDMERTPEFNMVIGLNFGGDGFGWALEPSLSVGTAYFKKGDSEPARTADSTLVSLGLYTGPTFNIHLQRAFYLGLGAGVRGSYGFWTKGMATAHPVEVGARIPITATLYLASQLALVIEVGLGGGQCWWMTEYLGGSGKSQVFTADFGAGVRWR